MSEPLQLLMVEDETDLGDLIKDALQDHASIAVRIASDPQQALSMLQTNPRCDVVFSDIGMPGPMSGIDFAQHVQQQYPEIRIILASGYSRSQLPPLPGHVQFLAKPYRLGQLLAMLER